MNQADLQKLAEERLKDAAALIAAGRWEFGYYAAGYAVECALKSCVLARMVHTGLVFEEKWDARVCLTHDITKLVGLAGLTAQLGADLSASAAAGREFFKNWEAAVSWTVTSRYDAKSEAEAKGLFDAIADPTYGVLRWIRAYW